MHLIGNVVAWGDDNPKWESQESVELLDEHYYRNPAWFAENFNKYDNYDRKGSEIYVGEYAVTQGFGNMGSLDAALGEAVYMMGIFRSENPDGPYKDCYGTSALPEIQEKEIREFFYLKRKI